MALGSSGGTNLGSAYGKIHIDTTAMLLARKIVRDSAREMAEDTRRFGQSWDAASQTMRTSLRGMSADLKQVSSELTGLSVVAGAVSVKGLQASMSLKTIEASFKVMLGSEKAANEELARLRGMADETHQSFMKIAQTGQQMLAASKAYGVELSNLVSVSQQLALVDPTANAFDAAFAMREFLSGNEMSLARRFEGLDKDRIKEIIATTGTAQERVQALSDYMNSLGFSRDKLRELGEEGVFVFEVLNSEIQETLSTGFTPFLNDALIPATQQFSAWLKEVRATDPALLKLGAGFTLAAAAIAPLTFAASQLLGTLSTLKKMGVIKIAVVATIGGMLIEGAVKGMQFLADRGIGDPDLRSDSGKDPNAVLFDRLKQALVVIAEMLIDGSTRLTFMLWNIRLEIERAFLQIVLTLVKAGIALQQALGQDTSGLEIIGTVYKKRLGEVNDEQYELNQPGKFEAAKDYMRQLVLKPFFDFFFPEVQAAGEQTGDAIEQAGTTLYGSFAKALSSFIAAQAEAAQKIGELNDEYERETQRMAETRDIAAARERFDSELSRGRNLADFQRSQSLKEADWLDARAKRIAAFAAETGNLELQALARRTETLANYHRDEARRAEDHGRRLQEIQENTQVNVLKAAAKLDAIGVYNALQSGAMDAQRENTTFSVESTRRKEDLDLQLQQLDIALRQQQDERARAFAQQLAEEATQHEQQRAREEAEFALRIERENEDRALRMQRQQEDQQREDAIRKADQARKIQDLIKHLSTELSAYQAMLTNASAAFGQARQMFINFVNDARSAMASLGSGTGTHAPGGGGNLGSVTTTSLAPLANAATSFMKLLGFEEGARNIPYDMVAMLHQGEAVIPASQNPYAGGMGVGLRPTVNIEKIDISVGDIGDRSDADVIDLMGTALDVSLRQLFAQAAAQQT